ncbi:MAG TPA: family 20 glycosylhydrolase [Rhodanobacteraceae bacterium]|nr:family 20 glycosylhydrolase [Rhodanobacteraceae bacterium]
MQRLKRKTKWVRITLALLAVSLAGCAHVPPTPRAAPPGIQAGLPSLQELASRPEQQKAAATLWLIPRPARVAFVDWNAAVAPDTAVVVTSDDPGAVFAARHFVSTLARTTPLDLHVSIGGTPPAHAIVFELDPDAAVANAEGYTLDTESSVIRVRARTPAGLFHGGVTLWQLLTPGVPAPDDYRELVTVPALHIEDWPRFKWRGLMLDSARHFQSVAHIEKLIDWMSLHKLNVLHWHLTDDQGWRLQVPKYPELTRIGACRKAVGPDAALTGGPDEPYCGFYTEADVREIVRYAAQRFITIVPEIDMPGHSQAAIASYPWLGVTGKRPQVSTDWGINTWLLRPDARTLKFVDDVMDEVMKLFPSKYIHIGGDEAAKDRWEASPAVRAHMRKLGLANMDRLQGWFTTEVANYLSKHGRTAVGWDEILQGKVPASAVVMSWHAPTGALRAIEQGHDVVMASSPTLYLDHYQSGLHDEPPGRPGVESLQDVYDYDPVPPGASAAQARHVLGLQANLWTEYMPTFARVQHAVFPRIAALSEVAWSPASTHDWHGFLERMPAELARYRALGINYADSAFAPAFAMIHGQHGAIDVALSNQSDFGTIHYTTDGSVPTADSPAYATPLSLPPNDATTLRATAFAGSAPLSAPRTQIVDATALLTRNSDELDTCRDQLVLRLEDDRPLHGTRPVYRVDIEDTCWLWKGAPLDGVRKVALTVGNLPWNFQLWTDNAKVVTRPKTTPAGEFKIHEDSCDGPLLATLPLARATQTKLQTTLTANIPSTSGRHDLCIFATGDPRDGLWAIDKIELQKAR